MSGNANAVAAINNAIATQDEATISAAAAANCDDAIAAAQAQAAAEAAAKAAQEAAQAVEPQTETQTQTSGKADMLRTP